MKECQKCFKTKPKREFTKSSAAEDGLKTQCKGCVSTYNREYKQRYKTPNR